ncbi:MAG: ABC transporter substrate-binding protein [Deltaproteobacteria bacterium]
MKKGKEKRKDLDVLGTEISRRDFIRTTALGTAGLAFGSLVFSPFTYGAEKPIRIGMIQEYTVGATAYGYWLGKTAKAAVAKLNAEGGIAGRKVELVDYDTKVNPAWASSMFKKLILEDKVDFVMGSVHSGVQLAVFPLANQFKMPYFGGGAMAASLTGKDAVPYYSRIHTHAKMQAAAGWKWGFDNLGKNWTFLVADYAWGHSLAEEFGSRIQAAGGKTQTILAPQNTSDFVPYLQKVSPDSKVLFTAFLGAPALGVMRQTVELGLHKRLQRFTVICCTDGVGQETVGKESAGAHYLSYYPRHASQVPKELQAFDKAYRKAVGMTDDGKDAGDPKNTATAAHMWTMWTTPCMIKMAVEQSGWKEAKNTRDFMKAFNQLKVKAGPWAPQGDLTMRDADHQGFHDHYLEEVQPDLKLKVIARIPKDKLMYDAPVDLRAKL